MDEGRVRWMALFWPLVLLFGLTMALIAVRLNVEVPAMTSDEMFEHQGDWSEEELTRLIGKSLSPFHNRNKREEVIEVLRERLAEFPPEARRRIIGEAFGDALDDAWRERELLYPEDRPRMAAMLLYHADQTAHMYHDGAVLSRDMMDRLLTDAPENDTEEWQPVLERWARLFPVE